MQILGPVSCGIAAAVVASLLPLCSCASHFLLPAIAAAACPGVGSRAGQNPPPTFNHLPFRLLGGGSFSRTSWSLLDFSEDLQFTMSDPFCLNLLPFLVVNCRCCQCLVAMCYHFLVVIVSFFVVLLLLLLLLLLFSCYGCLLSSSKLSCSQRQKKVVKSTVNFE